MYICASNINLNEYQIMDNILILMYNVAQRFNKMRRRCRSRVHNKLTKQQQNSYIVNEEKRNKIINKKKILIFNRYY